MVSDLTTNESLRNVNRTSRNSLDRITTPLTLSNFQSIPGALTRLHTYSVITHTTLRFTPLRTHLSLSDHWARAGTTGTTNTPSTMPPPSSALRSNSTLPSFSLICVLWLDSLLTAREPLVLGQNRKYWEKILFMEQAPRRNYNYLHIVPLIINEK